MPKIKKSHRIFLLIFAAVLLTATTLFIALQFKLHGLERDMRIYLIEQGVAEKEILHIEARRSKLPTYPVLVTLSHRPDQPYMFKPDEEKRGEFVLIGSALPPQLIDREAQTKRYIAYLQARGFTDIKHLGTTDSALMEKGEAVWELAQQYWTVPEANPQSFEGQRAYTYKFNVEHPTIRESLGLHAEDRLNAYLTLIGDQVRMGYFNVQYVAAEDRKQHKEIFYTLQGKLPAE
ncbi:hypothetical protein [Saccharibacillus kuerlensis]|uniref:Uncharacterized protein n=1 Tax=Saccharibacillus kuerlensis TaxID=459527 RepID=A0ABQ2L288_9BACL|nr:hypothetical protein [Saccharibacillus kuerlensis]GGN98614.1 hypothetical protein GCM10010969_17910 [Saccharibacillus kuerlensis]